MEYVITLNREPDVWEKGILISKVYRELAVRGIKVRKVYVQGNRLYVEVEGGEFSAQFITMLVIMAVAVAVASIGMAITSWQVGGIIGSINDTLAMIAPALILTIFGIAIIYLITKVFGSK